ncbi:MULTISPECIES: DUF3169 family protein [unclassified Staphylococcus]|uniref:DUF3169 family protein n=1 Tax=unclassified Staphylococcus TaxID=91994 RepID=UPI0021D1C988|nr:MULTISPECIES: DUF3169 family protein [unclassified Staphylococcus]UXR71773.1 DUF3169 family protein [Staphylococcus sp. IVB6240]UXR76469.1 DUF3169 family protein [Staphylococcus sp. IVB6233]UXR80596.1 DUF3169 family protein [Staphylococcus sp. IVB6218]
MKVMRTILTMLFGGIIGGMIGLLFADSKGFRFITELHFAEDQTVKMVGYAIIAMIIGLLCYQLWLQKHILKQKREMTQTLSDTHTETDQIESQISLLFWRTSVITQVYLLLSFIFMLFVVLNNSGTAMTLFVIVIFFIASVSSWPYGIFVQEYDPRFPKLGEKNYTEKLLNLMDEGEQHITLLSMYKVHTMNTMFIVLGIFLLSIFSLESGINQSFGVIILVFLFAYNLFGYQFRVRKFYK